MKSAKKTQTVHWDKPLVTPKKISIYFTSAVVLVCCLTVTSKAQTAVLNLSDAVKTGINNYQNIQAKRNYIKSSQASVQNVKNQYLPDVTASIQQAYGTVNGQFGAAAAFGPAVSTSGPVYTTQSWNAAFGSIYLLNTNWEFISFGRLQSRIDAANKQVLLDSANLDQEMFVQSVKISGTYLNLLIAQRLVQIAKSNIDRVSYVQQSVLARTKSGLIAGVDSSITNAEVSSARLALIQAQSNEQQIRNQLAQAMNITPAELALDTSFFVKIPTEFTTSFPVENNPQVKFYERRIQQSDYTARYIRKSIYPGVNLFGTFQSRGSGFDNDYTPEYSDRYSKNYFDGIKPERYNYLFGVGLAWNFVSPVKVKQQAKAQQYISEAYKNEYDLVSTQLKDQLILSDQQIENSIKSVKEAPLELKAAQDAYLQKTVLYKNGLTDIIDVQQALYALYKAQTDINVAYINVWQALLLKAAATGDFDLFLKQAQ